jgi:diaminopimelate epimerase
VGYDFWKGHGTENDFVLLPDHDGSVHGDLSRDRVRALCDRRAGLGADGVLRVIRSASVEPVETTPVEEGAQVSPPVEDGAQVTPPVEEGALRPSRDQGNPEWFMDYRNADGVAVEMCGNGIRVFARHLIEQGLVPADQRIRIGTRAGVKTVTRDGDLFTAALGVGRILGETKVGVADRSWPAVHVDVGNPHAVAFVDSLDDAGPLLEAPSYDGELYPEGLNVEFVVRRGPGHVAMRVHERGSGETRSCGTGACAAAIAAADSEPGTWRVDVPGGTLTVSIDADGQVFLTGPAVIVAQGTTDL